MRRVETLLEPFWRYEGEGWPGEIQEPIRAGRCQVSVERGEGLDKLGPRGGGGGGEAEERLNEVYSDHHSYSSKHSQILEAFKTPDDAGKGVGDVGELVQELGDVLVQEQGDEGSVDEGVEPFLLQPFCGILEG